MRIAPVARAGTRNLLLLVLVFLPVFLLLAGLLTRFTRQGGATDVIGTATVLYVGFILPVLTGGVFYLIILFAAAHRNPSRPRALALLLSPLIVLGLLIFGVGYVLTTPHFAAALVVALLVYGWLVRIPPQSGGDSERGSVRAATNARK